MPMVFYDRIPHGMNVSQVIVDDYMKSFFLVENLIRSGYRNIAHIKGSDDIYNSIERFKGYKDALAKFGIEYNDRLVIKCGMDFEDGAMAANELLKRDLQTDAVFAFTDTLAIGCMNRLREAGKKIPEEVSIASFSGTILSTIVHPQLTTVEPPLLEMGKNAAQLILEKISDPESPNRSIVLNAEIKIRESSMKDKQ